MTTTNGDVKSLRDQRRLLETQIELERVKQSTKLLESLCSWDDDFGGYDAWLRTRFQDGDGTRWFPLSNPSDRRHGGNWPLWRTEQELDELRQYSRILCATNAYARGLLRNLTNYIVGKGCAYKVIAKDADPQTPGMQTEEALQDLVRRSQAVVDQFLRHNRWNGVVDPRGNLIVTGSREREIFRRVRRDGEAFLRFFPCSDGVLVVRLIEPEQIRNPAGGTYLDGWSYGIRHRVEPFEDVETPEQYHVVYQDAAVSGAQGEVISADEVLHLRGPDCDGSVKRGIPDFVWDVAQALERASKLQRNLSMGAAIRAATAEIWQHAVGTSAQISSLAASFKELDRVNPITGKNERIERIAPGAIRRIPAGQQLVQPPAEQSTPQWMQGVQGDLRQAGAAFAAPEYWTGDASNGNYSSLETASAPAVKNGETEQEYYKSAYARVVWKAIEHAVDVGLLEREALTRMDLQVEAPAVLHRNDLEKSQADQIKVTGGWKSRQTCAMEDGLDWDIEATNNDEYNERFGAPGPGLAMPDNDLPAPDLRESDLREVEDSSGHKHDSKGKFSKSSGSKKNAIKAGANVTEKQPSQKAKRAKAAHKLTGKEIQQYSEEHNEPSLAKAIRGKSHPDSEPMDVTRHDKNGKETGLVELKTMTDNSNNKITMDSYSQIRKINHEKETGLPFHTIVFDDTLVFNANGPGKHDDSKRRILYRRGVAGSARIDSLHVVEGGLAGLGKIMDMPEKDLPDAARRTDSKHRIGKWKFINDEKGKGYKNSQTGQIFRAKK